MFIRRRTTVLVLASALCCSAGCVERVISITSEPSGSLVHLNDEEVGRTPLTVPFTFYGVYDVRLSHEKRWLPIDQAAAALRLSANDVMQLVRDRRLESRIEDGGELVLLGYRPLWTRREAKAPWWEAPGPDLVAEAIPHGKSEIRWHFELQCAAQPDVDLLIDHARQLRATLDDSDRSP